MAVTRQLQVERRTGKFAGHRPTFYRCAAQPTILSRWFVHPSVRTDLVTTISHERLEQLC